MVAHTWVHSTVFGRRGELMCLRCHVTNYEAAALGTLNECNAPPRKDVEPVVSPYLKLRKRTIEEARADHERIHNTKGGNA